MMKRCLAFILLFIMIPGIMSCTKTRGRTTYYVDQQKGDDSHNGRSVLTAWQSIKKINATDFAPGDRILFKSGQEFEGSIHLGNVRGKPDRPIIFSSFGDGKAIINGGESSALFADRASCIIITKINFRGAGRKNGNKTSGVVLRACDHIHIDSVDVSGFQKAGIDIIDSPDIKITRAHAFQNGSAGIRAQSWEKLNKNLYIGYCFAENNPGDPTNLTNHSGNGIIVGGADGCVIEYSRATNNGWDMPREGNGPVGIWAWHSNAVVIQHCISHHNKTSEKAKDGGGFDFDGGVTNSIMQYNLSYENEGAGFGLYQYAGAATWTNNVIRYNISVHDGCKNGQCGIHVWAAPGDEHNMSTAQIYNNTIINRFGHAVAFLLEKSVKDFYFANNIFYSSTEQVSGLYDDSKFEHNLYWSADGRFAVDGYTSLFSWAQKTGQEKRNGTICGIHDDPRFILAAESIKDKNPQLLKEFTFFQTDINSPCRAAGILLPNHANHDFWSNTIPDSAPDVGAFQH